MAFVLSASIAAGPMPLFAQTREAAVREAVHGGSAGALQRLLGDSGGFDRPGLQLSAPSLPAAPLVLSVRDAAGRGPAEPNGWDGFARDAKARGEDRLSRVLAAAGSLAERKGDPEAREAFEAARQAAKAGTWLWAKRAFSKSAQPGEADACARLIGFAGSEDAGTANWLKGVAGEGWETERRAGALSALPELAKAWKLPAPERLGALLDKTLARAKAALKPAPAPRGRQAPLAKARQLPPSPKAASEPRVGASEPQVPGSSGVAPVGRAAEPAMSAESGPLAQADAPPLVLEVGAVAAPKTSVYDKLSQRADLAGHGRSRELAELERILKSHGELGGDPGGRGAPGAVESGELKWANLEALKRALSRPPEAAEESASAAKPPLAGTPKEKEIEAVVARLEAASAEAQKQVGARDAVGSMLAAADRTRGSALRARRSAREQMEFRKNFSRLAMVMELSYTLNLLTSAEAAAKGMQAILDKKLSSIQAARKRSEDAARQARERNQNADQWRQESKDKEAESLKNAGLFTGLNKIAERFVDRVTEFRGETSRVIAQIEARDRGQSPDAASEYRRRLALAPTAGQATHGGGLSDFSVADLERESARVKSYLAKCEEGASRLDQARGGFEGALIVAVPGVPEYSLTNPTAGAIAQMLSARKSHWLEQEADLRKKSSSLRDLTDPSGTKRSPNAFGDLVPDSIVVYRREALEKASRARGDADRLAREMDAASARLGAGLPSLSGRSVDDLRTAIPAYAEALDRFNPTSSSADPLDSMSAGLDKLKLARMLPEFADAVIQWAEHEKTAETIEPYLAWLPGVAQRLEGAQAGLRAVVDDVAADEAWVAAGMPPTEAAAILPRKKALVERLRAMLRDLDDLLEKVLIPKLREREQGPSPGSGADGYEALYKAKLDLIERTHEAYEKTVPWAIAGWGAKAGDTGMALGNIATQRKNFQDYRQRVVDFKDEIRRRTDPESTETEDLYGERVPFSLVVRIKNFEEEKGRRAAQLNAAGSAINDILRQLDQDTKGRYGLSASALPTGISAADPGAVARLRALADSGKIQALAERLKRVADDGQAAAGSPGLDIAGGGAKVPTGDQPPVTLPEGQRVALMALEAIKRLVPSSANPTGDSFAEAMARFLFADAVMDGSRKALNEQIPLFKPFLERGAATLDRVFSDLDADEAFVRASGGSGESVYGRKLSLFAIVRDVAGEGSDLFERKAGWDKDGGKTVDDVVDFYNKTGEIYDQSLEAIKAEEQAALQYKASIDAMAKQWTEQKNQVLTWLKQLNDPHETAMNRIAQNLSALQEKTRAVLETNVAYKRLEREFKDSQKTLEDGLHEVQRGRKELSKALGDVRTEDLSPELAARIDKLTLGGPAWLSASPHGPQTLVIPKAQLTDFLATLFGALDASSRDIVGLRDQLAKNPAALAQLLPNSQMLELGDDPNGFYLVYQSNFSTPGGLETESAVTLGNVGHVGLADTNLSVIGYKVGSPPSAGNAPFGDQGVTVRAESLGGEHAVNYLDVTFHRFLQNIPTDMRPDSQAKEARMMVFDDFAMMLAGDRLYFGAVGFADFAIHDTKNKPHYYGGNVKTSIKFSELMRLNAEQSALFASDPRTFMQKVNLDFTRFDPTLNQDFVISAKGEQKQFLRRKVGAELDLQRGLQSWFEKDKDSLPDWLKNDTFTLEVFHSQLEGTDDISQRAMGATVVKGFAFNLGEDMPARVTTSVTGELGEKYNTLGGRVSFELTKQQVTVSAQGKQMGDAGTYHLEVRKKLSDTTDVSVGYGSPYVGLNHRLTIGLNTTFTLGQLWRTVVGETAQDAIGGKILEGFQKDLDKFFERDAPDGLLLGELRKVFAVDVGQRLLQLEIGALGREIGELQNAGALLDNSRVRAMVGFVSNPIAMGDAERATGGGFQVGTQNDLTLNKTQKKLVEAKIATLFQLGLGLQTRLLELAREWERAVSDVVQAQWELGLAAWAYDSAPEAVLRAEAEARAVEAAGKLRQARLRYNHLTGYPPDAETLSALNPRDFDQLLHELGDLLDNTDRVSTLLRALDPERLPIPKQKFNPLDWIPWIEGLTVSIGAQLQDLLANQVLGAGITIRIPIYNPESELRDKAYELQAAAVIEEMRRVYKDYQARAQAERLQAQGLQGRVAVLAPESIATAKALGRSLRDYRNGLQRRDELWASERRWRETLFALLDARARLGLARAWAEMDEEEGWSGGLFSWQRTQEGQAKDLAGALAEAVDASPDLEALALRSRAAAELMAAGNRRYAKWGVDLFIGTNLTADGIGWIPAFGITGIGIFPIVNAQIRPDELRELETARRGAESQSAAWLGASMESDLAVQLVTQASAWSAAAESLTISERDLIPQLEREAGAPGSGAEARNRLAAAQAEAESLRTQRDQARSALNFLLGRDPNAAVSLGSDPQALVAQLQELFAKQPPLEARRRVLEERIKTARAVETIVDKNLKVQEIRVEPVSLIGRSLGRLIAALSGSGDSSPELVARARNQTLEAERAQAAFERDLPATRSRLSFQLAFLDAELRALEGQNDPRSRMRAAGLKNRRVALQAQAASLGLDLDSPPPSEGLPTSWAELKNRLVAAVESRVAPSGLSGIGDADLGNQADPGFTRWYGRFFDAIQTLGKEPIGKWFAETWVEFRLRNPFSTPEGLLALSQLEEQKADELRRAAAARGKAEAEMLLARFASRANFLRWANARRDGSEGPSSRPSPAYVAALEDGLRQDFGLIAAHLGLSGTVRPEALAALVPRESSAEPERAAQRARAEMDEIDWSALRRILFEDGVPDAVAAVRDGVLQLKADLIAEKMSYKGFTPVIAFGIFRGQNVGGAFLEAPDPRLVEKGLREVLTDALRQELESQDRLRTLGLKLHALMAEVADRTNALAARLKAVRVARDNWAGTQIEAARGLAPESALAAAQAQADRAEEEYLDALLSLRLHFVELATELSALGHQSLPRTPRQVSGAPSRQLPGATAEARERLLEYWTDRMLDAGFEAELGKLFDGRVPTADREALTQELDRWRRLKGAAETLRVAPGLDPAERLRLFGRTDVEGRRAAVLRRLERVLGALGGWPNSGPAAPPNGGQELWAFLMKDLEAEIGKAKTGVEANRSLAREMREAFWKAAPAGAAAQAAYRRLSPLKAEVEDRRDALLAAYLDAREQPESFLLRNVALDAYLKAVQAYDSAVISVFGDSRLAEDRLDALRLNSVFSLSESGARRRDLLRHGRALLAADILIEAESARLDALRYEAGGPEAGKVRAGDIGSVSQRIAWLKRFRERLIEKPELLPSLAAGVDRTGDAREWWTLEELKGLERADRVVTVNGERWVLPAGLAGAAPRTGEELEKAGALRVIMGVDAAQQALKEGREEAKRAELDRQARALLADADFVLQQPDGSMAKLTLAQLRELEARGRVFYFDGRLDRRGLRPALHPLAARWVEPRHLVILVAKDDAGAADRYPTLESLYASGEKDRFSELKTGPRGARALAAEAERSRDRSLAGGWILLKLDGYAFALAPDGAVQAVYMNDEELEKARARTREAKDDDPVKRWTYHKAKDLELLLAEDGTLVEARLDGHAVFRREGLTATRRVRGELFGAQLDHQGRLVRAYTDRGEMEREAKGWWMEDYERDPATGLPYLWPGDGSRMSPRARLRRYVECRKDKNGEPLRETCVPIVLGRAFLARYLESAKDGEKAAKRWAYMPWNWPNILLETPRGIIKTPMELLTGSDPNQSGYIGRVYMRRGEGGATVHRGPLGKVVHWLDFLEILPDPVERYYDPSQFPKLAEGDGPLKPGHWSFEGTPEAGGKDLHLGAQGWLRRVRYANEDVEEARGRILGAFEGGVRSAFVETVRGRAGQYAEAKVEHASGRLAMEQALRQVGVLADSNGDAAMSATPGHLAVDRVEGDIQVRLGAEQHEAGRRRYEAWAEELEKDGPGGPDPGPGGPGPDLAALEAALTEARASRVLAQAAEAAAPAARRAFRATAFPPAGLLASRGLPLP